MSGLRHGSLSCNGQREAKRAALARLAPAVCHAAVLLDDGPERRIDPGQYREPAAAATCQCERTAARGGPGFLQRCRASNRHLHRQRIIQRHHIDAHLPSAWCESRCIADQVTVGGLFRLPGWMLEEQARVTVDLKDLLDAKGKGITEKQLRSGDTADSRLEVAEQKPDAKGGAGCRIVRPITGSRASMMSR